MLASAVCKQLQFNTRLRLEPHTYGNIICDSARHEKTGLIYTKYTHSYYCKYLPYCIRYSQSVSNMRFLINYRYINSKKFVRLLCLYKKLFNFELEKCGQILYNYVHIRPIFSCWVTF